MANTGKTVPVYIRSANHAWIPAIQLKIHRGSANVIVPKVSSEQDYLHCEKATRKFRYHDNQIIDLKDYPNGVLPMQNVDANGRLEDYPEMVDLPCMSEAAILYNLKFRHQREKPYTRTGDIVIAVNPYKWYDELYTEDKKAYYTNRLVWESQSCSEDPRATMPPHVYEVSALAYKGLAFGDADQSILVSGESGAGKTETVKLCLNHIASAQSGPLGYFGEECGPIVQRVVQSNPLLEAFGNAQTRRNDNSSRFGKFLLLQFDRDAPSHLFVHPSSTRLVGSKCDVYLLEKNRVVGHASDERTFHIFYQLLASPHKTQFWEGLRGATPDSFKYVGASKIRKIEGLADEDHFDRVLEALALVGVTGDSLKTLMQAICITMQLGNLGFGSAVGDTDKSIVTTPEEMQALSALMGVPEPDLGLAFTERTFKTVNETHKVPLNAAAAADARDALAKETYQKTFQWLVSTTNKATCAPVEEKKKYKTIGLLDIFGFETFDVNRFEQLCINYANEKLQQKFTEDVFANVQAEYQAEGIPMEGVSYDDNQDVIDLIEGSTGLLALLNEECIRPKGNDLDFVQKVLQINKNSPALIVHRTDRLSFGIQHYAGLVMYDAEMFVGKNLDTLPTDLHECSKKCTNVIINTPYSVVQPERRKATPRWTSGSQQQSSSIAAATVMTKYKGHLNDLMASLRQTQSRYIRCIKPNNEKKPIIMDHWETVEQLRCAGVVAGITIARSTYPNRLPNSLVLARFSHLMDLINFPSHRLGSMSLEEKRAADAKALMSAALQSKITTDTNGKQTSAFVVGKTKTFFRAGAMEFLESKRVRGLDVHATAIQRAARGWLSRNQGKNENQRKRMDEAARLSRQKAAEERSASVAQAHAVQRAERLKALQTLQEMCDQLEQAERQAERTKRDTLDKLAEIKQQGLQDLKELKELLDAKEKDEIIGRRVELARQEKLLEENKKLIHFLKKENLKIRKDFAKKEGKLEEEVSTHCALEESYRDFSEGVGVAEEMSIKEETRNSDMMNDYESARALNREMKTKFRSKQDEYLEQATARLQLQKSLANIITIIDNNENKPNTLVSEINGIIEKVESFSKAEMAALEAEFVEDCPQGDYTETEYAKDTGLAEE